MWRRTRSGDPSQQPQLNQRVAGTTLHRIILKCVNYVIARSQVREQSLTRRGAILGGGKGGLGGAAAGLIASRYQLDTILRSNLKLTIL